MSNKQKNILEEAILEGKQIKKAATKNAEALLAEHFKDRLRDLVESQLNERASDSQVGLDEDQFHEYKFMESDLHENEDKEDCEDEEDDEMKEESFDYALEGEDSEGSDDELAGLDLSDESDEDSDEEGGEEDLDTESLDHGLTEADLDEALEEALQEVTHGQLGDVEHVGPDKHDTGLLDTDSSEKGWDEKTPPAAKDMTVKEAAYKAKIAKLVKENIMHKKAYKQLLESLNEVKLFNAQLFYANKIMNRFPGMKNEHKQKVVKSIEKARNLQEVQTIYNSLDMAFSSISETVAKQQKKTSRLTEALGYDKKSAGKALSKVDDSHLNEGAGFDRMRALAGLIKE